jgi:O-antigen ligase/polysaccharide polymerase Wzy-like membrane protein
VAGMPRLLTMAVVAAIAAAYFAISLADGGSSILLIAFMTAVIWWAVIVGLVLGILPRARVPARAIFAAASLGALGLFAALSMTWASDDGGAFIDVLRAAAYLGILLLVVLASPRGSARVWLAGLAIGLAGLAAWALVSRFLPGLPGGEENIATFLPDASGRLSYPVGYWNALGACTALGAVLLTWLGTHAAARPARALAVAGIPICGLALYMTASAGAALAAAVGAALLLVLGPARPRLVAAMLLGGAGSAALILLVRVRHDLVDAVPGSTLESQGHEMLAFTLGVALLVGLVRYLSDVPLERLRVNRALALAGGVAVLAGVVAIGVSLDPVTQIDEFCKPPPEQLASQDAASDISRLDSSGRCQYWEVAIDGFTSDPAIGVGAGGYETLWNQNATFTRQIRHAHSLFFEDLAELGLPGLLFVLGLFAPAVWVAWRRPGLVPLAGGEFGVAAAVLATGIASASLDWTWEFPSAFIPVVTAIALLTGVALYRPSRADTIDDRTDTVEMEHVESSGRGFGWGVATLAVGWAAIIVAAIVFFTEAKLIQSESAASDSELERAAQDARDAATLQPWAAQPWVQIALLEELSGDLVGAQEAIHEASVRSPDDWRIWLLNARFEVGLDDLEGARASLDRARELNPMAQIFQRREAIPASQQQFQANLKSGPLGKQLGIEDQTPEAPGNQAAAPDTNPKAAGVPSGWNVSSR